MLREEMKKIWRPSILTVLVFLAGIFYWMFLEFSIRNFPNGPYFEALFLTAETMVETYGTTLEPEEFEEFAAGLPALVSEADAYIRMNSIAQEYGISSYDEYLNFSLETMEILNYSCDFHDSEQLKHASSQLILNYLTDSGTGNIHAGICAVQEYISQYAGRQEAGIDSRAGDRFGYQNDREYENALNRFFSEKSAWRNILPYELIQTTGSYLGLVLVWMILSICILLAPVLVKDRMRNMRPLQWSSRRGRGIAKTQCLAVMMSAFILSAMNILIFGGLFSTNGISMFFECRMFSFMMTGYSWVNWSYGIWCAVLAAISFIACLGTAGIVFFLSYCSSNYITMLLKVILLFACCAYISVRMLTDAFYYGNQLYRLTSLPMIEMTAAGVLLSAGCVLSAITIAKTMKKDLY